MKTVFGARSLRRCLAGLVMVIALAGAASAQNLARLAAKSELGTALIAMPEGGSGSGFVVSQNARGTFYVVTNQHVVGGASEAIVFFGIGTQIAEYLGQVIARSADLDLAVIEVIPRGDEGHEPEVLNLASRDFQRGEEVYALGFPGLSMRQVGDRTSPDMFESTVSRGVISKVSTGPWEGRTRQLEIVQHTSIINRGNSGGPLFDFCGRVVGVNTAGFLEQSVYFSSSGNTLQDYLDSVGVDYNLRTGNCNPQMAALMSGPTLPVVGAVVAFMLAASAFLVISRRGGAQAVPAGGAGGSARKPSAGPGAGGGTVGSGPAVLRLGINDGQGNVVDVTVARDALAAGAVIGRDEMADIQVAAEKMSREHARLGLADRKLTLTDLGSTNGTKVDGRRIQSHKPVQINTKSMIELGDVRIAVRKA